jgi:hypothetical protein
MSFEINTLSKGATVTMEIENLKPFDGQHCETTATGTLLRQLG